MSEIANSYSGGRSRWNKHLLHKYSVESQFSRKINCLSEEEAILEAFNLENIHRKKVTPAGQLVFPHLQITFSYASSMGPHFQ